MCKSHMIVSVSFFNYYFLTKIVSGWYTQLPLVMLHAANMAAMRARAERRATHHVSATILAPVRARMSDSPMCACLSGPSSLLPDSIGSNSAPPDVLLCSLTPRCYVTRVVWSGAVRCQASGDVAVSCSRGHVVT